MKYTRHEGKASPLGCTETNDGLNFALFSQHATAVKLCLFQPDEPHPFLELALDPSANKTGSIWHIFIRGLPAKVEYGYRLNGPYDLEKGHLYNPRKLVSDPYAKSLSTPYVWRDHSLRNKHFCPRGRVLRTEPFDWGSVKTPDIPFKDLVIYEMHVRAFTCDPSSAVKNPGTFLGLIEKIPYLKKLGINAVELMPIHEFNEEETVLKNPKTGDTLCNFWGYSTLNFFSPMNRYASSGKWTAAQSEFKQMIKEMHRNGIEVILDVVYNHTAEEEKYKEKYFSFRGIDNSCYYLIDNIGTYLNFSGCGNTVNCNHPVVSALILDSLRYWVSEMHVDGFRFDLASILTRGMDGIPMDHPPLIEQINNDPILSKTKLIAEPWDAIGLYQVGNFPGQGRWAEWNGQYRDAVRRFIKGTNGEAGTFAKRLCGSEDLYGYDRDPFHSINFVTAHDGYTLRDLVTYQEKNNIENGQGNHDGSNDNLSWNCGVEGETDDLSILVLRERQMRNFFLALILSWGTPMLLMGDEYAHTRNGNNNAWCQDNELNWFQWDKIESNADFFRFFRMSIAFRNQHPFLKRDRFLTDQDIQWHGHRPFQPDWENHSRFVAYTLKDKATHQNFYIAFNANYQSAIVNLPQIESKPWYRLIDTSLPSPEDFLEDVKAQAPLTFQYLMPAYSALVAVSD